MLSNMDRISQTISLFDRHAQLYMDKYMDVSLYAESFDFFASHLPGKTVLELGCGPGNVTSYLLKKNRSLEILATDLAPAMLGLAKINNPHADFAIMDCRNILSVIKKFDGIMCAFCLPYLSKEEAMELIADASKSLRSRGLLYISTMEDDYSTSGINRSSSGEEILMFNHERDYLVCAFADNNFEMVFEQRKKYSDPYGKPVTDLLLIGKLKP
ncbi:MAG: class I SAM-dependent methyltransferase [Flavobacterium sp.]|nr:MAG: class I SAM-dependent methyltransferase [Flavobacterium sp.]